MTITTTARFSATILAFVALLATQTAAAQESHSKALAKYITSDVVGVLYIDLDKLDLDATIKTASKLGFQEQDELADLVEAMPMIKFRIERLKEAGITRAYALLRASDIQTMGTSWVLPVEAGKDSGAAKEIFASALPMFRPHFLAEIEATEGAVLAAPNKFQLNQLKNSHSTPTDSRQAMWDSLGSGTIGVAMFGDEDTRRVIRELMPPLPAPFESITGELIADGLDWGGMELTLGKTSKLKLEFQATNETAAATFEQGLTKAYGFLQELPQTKQYLPKSEFGFVFDALAPTRSGQSITVSTEKLFADFDRLAKVLSPQVKLVRMEAAKLKGFKTIRQLALANHNFESAHSHFPTQATVDKKGNPLLSWRVQILPFINQTDLWKQFHLDEPWDSEHNIKLVEKMPEIFKDSNPRSRKNNKAGKTIYLGAAGEGMVFDGSKEIRFGDMKDGSSNTIMLVTVAREHAVPWTKPVDWQVDLKNPSAQLKEEGRTEVDVAIADGSTHRFSIDTDSETWRRLVKIDDGEVVEWPR